MLNGINSSGSNTSLNSDREPLIEEDNEGAQSNNSNQLKRGLYCLGAGACTLAAVGVGIGFYLWAVSNSTETVETNTDPLPHFPLDFFHSTAESTLENITTTAGEVVQHVTRMAADSCLSLVNETECIIKNVCDHLVFYKSSSDEVSGVLTPGDIYNCTDASSNTSFSLAP